MVVASLEGKGRQARLPDARKARRIAAVVLPDLLLELGRHQIGQKYHGLRTEATDLAVQSGASKGSRKRGAARKVRQRPSRGSEIGPLGVVLVEDSEGQLETDEEEREQRVVDPRWRLAAVGEKVRRLGVRPGNSLAEAWSMVSQLEVVVISGSRVLSALGQVAEALMSFAPTVSIESPDTIWVDVTGAAHLLGGEENLVEDILGTVIALGYRARVALSKGPRTAQAIARFGIGVSATVVPEAETQKRISGLPLSALPISSELVSWLMRLGIFSVGELASLPRAATAARLKEHASVVLGFCRGEDPEPLVPYRPAQVLVESQCWDEPVAGIEALVFILRRIAARISARLVGRGLAACECELVLTREKSVARFEQQPLEHRLLLPLAVPLWREEELFRVLRVRLEQTGSLGLIVGLRLEVPKVTEALGRQLDFSRLAVGLSGGAGAEESLPVLVAELSAEVGEQNVGVLRLFDSHRPEHRSALRPLGQSELSSACTDVKASVRKARTPSRNEAGRAGARDGNERASALREWGPCPTRLLPRPIRVEEPLRVGSLVPLGQVLYRIEGVRFDRRLESVEWWSHRTIDRDYVRLLLGGIHGQFEVLAYVDRRSRRRYICAISD